MNEALEHFSRIAPKRTEEVEEEEELPLEEERTPDDDFL
jgi:hypothetical protein